MNRLLRSLMLASLVLIAPAHAGAATPPLADAIGLVSTGHTTESHIAVVWPETEGQKYVRVTPTANGVSSTWVIELVGGDTSLPTTISAPCDDTGPTTITCTVSFAEMNAGIEVWTGNDADTVQFEDNATPSPTDGVAPVFAYLRDGGSTNGMYQFFIGGPANDAVDAATGNDATHVATNWFIGNGGTDRYVPSTADTDIVSYENHTASQPVDVTLDGVANDGFASLDGLENVPTREQGTNAVIGGEGDDVITGDAGSTFLDGQAGDDVIDGGAATDQLFGGTGDDILTGGTGNDWFYGDRTWEQVGYGDPSLGPDGVDQFFMRDGEADKLFECGGGIDVATMDLVEIDIDVPTSNDCETKDRAALGGGTGGGSTGGGSTGGGATGGGTTGGGATGGGTTDGDALAARLGAIPGTFISALVPTGDIETDRTLVMPDFVKKRKTYVEAERTLLAAKMNIDATYVGVPAASFPRGVRESVKPGQLLSTSPKAGKKLTSGFPSPSAKVTFTYFDPKLPKDAACPYDGKLKVGTRTIAIFDELKLMSVREASDKLDDYGCNWKIKSTVYNRAVTETQFWTLRTTGTGKKRLLNVVLASPKQPDFRASFSQPLQPGYEQELGLVSDANLKDGATLTNSGSVPAADQTRYFGVTVIERATARLVPHLTVALLDETGTEIAKGRTNENGSVLLQFATSQRSGVLRLVMEHVNANGEVLMSAVQELRVVNLGAEPWADLNGNVMNKVSSKTKVTYRRTGEVVASTKRARDPRTGRALAPGQRAMYELIIKMNEDIATMMASNGLAGIAMSVSYRALAEEFRGRLQAESVTAEQAARDTGISIAMLGNSLVPLSNAGVHADAKVSTTVGLIGADGASFTNFTGAAIVAAGAGNIVAAGGGNIVAAGAGNIVAAGGGNIVAAGGGNIVAAGGGNIVAAGAGNIVAAGAGNFVPRIGRKGWLPSVFAAYAGKHASTAFVADPRSMEVRTFGDTTVIANPDGSLPPGTKIATGAGETPIAIPGKLL